MVVDIINSMFSVSIISNSIVLLIHLPSPNITMKKWQIWVLWLVIWQVISTLKKDPVLREKVVKEPGILGKAKVFGEARIQDNKEIFEEIKNTDREKTIETVEKDISYDGEKIKKRTNEQSEKDRETEGHETARTIMSKIPDKKTLADWVEKYKQRIIKWRDAL